MNIEKKLQRRNEEGADDLRDTLAENSEHCVGMAARRIHRMRQRRAVFLSLAQERPRDIRI